MSSALTSLALPFRINSLPSGPTKTVVFLPRRMNVKTLPNCAETCQYADRARTEWLDCDAGGLLTFARFSTKNRGGSMP